MHKSAGFALLLSAATLWGCSHTVVVPVPPRMDLQRYGTLGIVEFASSTGPAIGGAAKNCPVPDSVVVMARSLRRVSPAIVRRRRHP